MVLLDKPILLHVFNACSSIYPTLHAQREPVQYVLA